MNWQLWKVAFCTKQQSRIVALAARLRKQRPAPRKSETRGEIKKRRARFLRLSLGDKVIYAVTSALRRVVRPTISRCSNLTTSKTFLPTLNEQRICIIDSISVRLFKGWRRNLFQQISKKFLPLSAKVCSGPEAQALLVVVQIRPREDGRFSAESSQLIGCGLRQACPRVANKSSAAAGPQMPAG